VGLLCAAVGVSCAEDEAANDCEWTLQEWCAEMQSCEGYETRDQALATVLDDGISLFGASACDDGSSIRVGGGLGGKTFKYDRTSGELVGAMTYSDALMEGCDRGNTGAGEMALCWDGCTLLSETLLEGDDSEACTGAVAEPFIAACMDEPPSLVVGCEACACTACYPTLLQCARIEREQDEPDACATVDEAIECIMANCSDVCADQLEST